MNGFTYFRSYKEAIRSLPDDMRLEIRDAIDDYMFDDIEPDFADVITKAIFELMRPTLETDKKKFGRRTAEYREWRRSVYERDNYTCMLCGQRGGDLNAHHIKPYALYPEHRYELDNGITLCVDCHRGVHRAR